MKGIFLAQSVDFPGAEVAVAGIGVPATMYLFGTGINPYQSELIFLGIVIGIVTAFFTVQGVRKIVQFVKHQQLARQIRRQTGNREED